MVIKNDLGLEYSGNEPIDLLLKRRQHIFSSYSLSIANAPQLWKPWILKCISCKILYSFLFSVKINSSRTFFFVGVWMVFYCRRQVHLKSDFSDLRKAKKNRNSVQSDEMEYAHFICGFFFRNFLHFSVLWFWWYARKAAIVGDNSNTHSEHHWLCLCPPFHIVWVNKKKKTTPTTKNVCSFMSKML